MFKAIIQSIKKSKRLKAISKELAKPFPLNDPLSIVKSGAIKNNHLRTLIELVKSDQMILRTLNSYNASDQTIIEIYDLLCRFGAGQYKKGHYVAASSVAYASTLAYLLEHFQNGSFCIYGYDQYNSGMYITNRLIKYFEKGEVGAVI
jgi:hypothetical protein